MNKKLEIVIASPLDREMLVAEIWFENTLIAEINQEHGDLEIGLYPTKENSRLLMNVFFEVMDTVKRKLLEIA